MSKYLFGNIVTAYGTAANNRGESEGNISTLQKILWRGEAYSSVSAEAIRWALRYYWQQMGYPVNRFWNEEQEVHEWQDRQWLSWTDPEGKGKDKEVYIDDDLLGFMLAEAAKEDGSDQKGKCDKRRGVLEVTRAVSLTPFAGDITFNAMSGEKGRTSLYGTELHATRYQFGFALTPEGLRERKNIFPAIDGLVSLRQVGGNHSRFLFDFSPASIVFRITSDFAPRILYCFEGDDNGNILSIGSILEKVKGEDILPGELVIGGEIVDNLSNEEKEILHGAKLFKGVRKAAETVKELI